MKYTPIEITPIDWAALKAEALAEGQRQEQLLIETIRTIVREELAKQLRSNGAD